MCVFNFLNYIIHYKMYYNYGMFTNKCKQITIGVLLYICITYLLIKENIIKYIVQ
jgi:hypothetical protein